MKAVVGVGLVVLVFGCRSYAREPIAGLADFKGAAPIQVVSVYGVLSGQEMVTSSNVARLRTTIWYQAGPLEKKEALKLIEKVLLKQAGVVLTKLDGKRVSVTYNDALPIAGGGPAWSGRGTPEGAIAPKERPAPAAGAPIPVPAAVPAVTPPPQKP
jgi:hypothetical protein